MHVPQTKQVTIDVPAFAGPLDLLLHLIDRSELDITAISLAQVTDQYLAQVQQLKENKVAQLIDFLVIGARLMVIKSRALLPAPPPTLEGDEAEEDPAEALLRQLRVYKQFKESAERLRQREEAGLHSYVRLATPPKRMTEPQLDLSGVSADTLYLMIIAVHERYDTRRDSVSVARPRVLTINDQISRLRNTAKQHQRFAFSALLSPTASRTELSVTLLATLELIKRREIITHQETMFGPIEINRLEADA